LERKNTLDCVLRAQSIKRPLSRKANVEAQTHHFVEEEVIVPFVVARFDCAEIVKAKVPH